MSNLNEKIALRMQEVSVEVWESVASLLPCGSYTANQVYEYFVSMNGKKNKTMSGLPKECQEKVAVEVDNFKCSVPRFLFFKILHKFEQLASLLTKNRKKFICGAETETSADDSFVVEITKPMLHLCKVADGKDGLRETLKRVALDCENGFIVATNGRLLCAMQAVFSGQVNTATKPILISQEIFKNCEGSTSVSVTEKNNLSNEKYKVRTSSGSYYEEESVGIYPKWKTVVPDTLMRDGRVTLSKASQKEFVNFAKQAVKNADKKADGKDLLLQAFGKTLRLSYSVDDVVQSKVILMEEEPQAFTICLDPKYLCILDGWNGTMWVSASDRCVIFDRKNTSDFYLLMPRVLPNDFSIIKINGKEISFEKRHTQYVIEEQDKPANDLQTKLQTELQTETEINNPKTPIFMATERFEGTQPFYTLSEIENGNYRIKGAHDSDLVLFIRTAAHFIRQDELLQSEFAKHCNESLKGKDWRSLVPMQEIALAEMFETFLASKGISEIPDVEFADTEATEEEPIEEEGNLDFEIPQEEPEDVEVEEVEVEEVEVEEVTEAEEQHSYVICITGTLDKSRKFYQEEIESRGWRLSSKISTSVHILVVGETKEDVTDKIKKAKKHGVKTITAEEFYQLLADHQIEAEEVIEEPIEATIKPMAIEREIVPTLELETTDGKLIVAGESYFRKLYNEEEGCFRSEQAEAKFNEIDAFIADELIQAEELDYEAIVEAVVAFMEEVEQAS